MLEEYFHAIGGRPVQKKSVSATPASTRKRGRKSITGTPASVKSAKKPRTSVTAQALAAATESAATPGSDAAESDAGEWQPPLGSWEDQIAHIDTIEKGEDGHLACFVQW